MVNPGEEELGRQLRSGMLWGLSYWKMTFTQSHSPGLGPHQVSQSISHCYNEIHKAECFIQRFTELVTLDPFSSLFFHLFILGDRIGADWFLPDFTLILPVSLLGFLAWLYPALS